jgi:hypothetical protein
VSGAELWQRTKGHGVSNFVLVKNLANVYFPDSTTHAWAMKILAFVSND